MRRLCLALTAAFLLASAPAWATPPVNTVPPTIEGSPVVGQTLTVNNGTWEPTPSSFTYSWEICPGEGECNPLSFHEPHINTQSYKPVVADVGHKLRALVAAWNPLNQYGLARTASVGPITEAPPPPSMLVGVDIGGWDWESAINDEAGAVKYVRSSYLHFNTDAQMALLAKVGVTLLPLFGEEGTIAGHDNATFVNEIVTWLKRYGKGGTYWAGKTDLGATTAEIMNEPGNPGFYPDCCTTAGHAAYADLTKKVKAALEANFASSIRAKTLVSYDGGYNGSQYGEEVFAAGAVADAVTVHPYGGHSNRTLSAQGNRPRVEQAHSKTGLPVYVTEVGWPTCGETGDSLNWTEAEQATNITNFGAWSRGLGYVAAFINFNYADYTGNCYGIVKSAGSPHKPSYEALAHA